MGPIAFDKKPIIMKRWEPDLNLKAECINEVPVWIRLPNVDLKFWGKEALMKIVSLVGNPVKSNRVTSTKETIAFARVMVEVPVNGVFPKYIEFLDEGGHLMRQRVVFEWKSISYSVCNGLGHVGSDCPNHKVQARRQNRAQVNGGPAHPQKVWKPIVKPNEIPATAVPTMNPATAVSTMNRFGGLESDIIEEMGIDDRTIVPASNMSVHQRIVEEECILGIDCPGAICDVLWFMKHHYLGLFGLLETKVKAVRFDKVFSNFNDEWSVVTNHGKVKGGRIWVVWVPSIFQNTSVEFLPKGLMDNNPCIVSMFACKKPFRFFNMWVDCPGFLETVKQAWDSPVHGTNMFRVIQKLKQVKQNLKKFNLRNFSDVENADLIAATCLAEVQTRFDSWYLSG
ncbi:uncharacterized protein LOC110732876 [Chenopodium quinoa]|uniref:uncharacterized protein LOC110732876 n=1 Tax=Chenopodium quinoa TaxID=63459 RepID=UPI000B786540|nr:uncharacterized protein LOC110732876 [Chenopodium quinoa]